MKHAFDTIEITRIFAARPDVVWRCWADPALKEAWFVTDNAPEWSASTYTAELSEGGEEIATFVHEEKGTFTIRSRVLIAETPKTFIYAYRMDSGDVPITASLVTLGFMPEGLGTVLTLTEQINFIDDGDSMETRVPGTEWVVEKMAAAAERIAKTKG